MGMGILVCGLNGAGKSTLGRALAERLGFYFLDVEDLYFPKTDPAYLYASPRTKSEVERLLLLEIQAHENFVFSSVTGKYGDDVLPYFQYAVLIDVPKEIRMQRVRERSFRKFGSRMLPGGDLYEEERRFLDEVASKPEDLVESWAQCLRCPLLRVDGTRPVEAILDLLLRQIGPCPS